MTLYEPVEIFYFSFKQCFSTIPRVYTYCIEDKCHAVSIMVSISYSTGETFKFRSLLLSGWRRPAGRHRPGSHQSIGDSSPPKETLCRHTFSWAQWRPSVHSCHMFHRGRTSPIEYGRACRWPSGNMAESARERDTDDATQSAAPMLQSHHWFGRFDAIPVANPLPVRGCHLRPALRKGHSIQRAVGPEKAVQGSFGCVHGPQSGTTCHHLEATGPRNGYYPLHWHYRAALFSSVSVA